MRLISSEYLEKIAEQQGHITLDDILNAPAVMSLSGGPLTPDELKQMGNKPYWHVGLRPNSPPAHWSILSNIVAKHPLDYSYGESWLAYRCETKEETIK